MTDSLWEELEEAEEMLREELARSEQREESRRVRWADLEGRAERELAWFYGELGGQVPAEGSECGAFRSDAATIAAALARLPAFHRGALSMMFTPREWPPGIERRFGSLASIVVRLECARRPCEGVSVEVAEEGAVQRLLLKVAERSGEVARLADRAEAHERLALRAYTTVRGDGRCLCPTKAERKRATALAAVGEVQLAGLPANDVHDDDDDQAWFYDDPANDVDEDEDEDEVSSTADGGRS